MGGYLRFPWSPSLPQLPSFPFMAQHNCTVCGAVAGWTGAVAGWTVNLIEVDIFAAGCCRILCNIHIPFRLDNGKSWKSMEIIGKSGDASSFNRSNLEKKPGLFQLAHLTLPHALGRFLVFRFPFRWSKKSGDIPKVTPPATRIPKVKQQTWYLDPKRCILLIQSTHCRDHPNTENPGFRGCFPGFRGWRTFSWEIGKIQ